ncbi:MAG: ABC transporter substrate-binding protein [Rhizobacter sp.]|nr:ABC transporter substrate-binding protein [Chlorobiales bacterium]
MYSPKRSDLVSSFLLFTLLTMLSGCAPQDDRIKIGQFASITGKEATFGISCSNGVKMAIDEANAAGGVLGKQIDLITLDDQTKAGEAATVVTKLINQEKVVAVLGEVASSRTLAAKPIAQQNKIPLLTPASTNATVTEGADYVFRICFIDPFQGTAMAKFTATTLQKKKAAILKDVKSDYSIGLSEAFTKKFKELGGEILEEQAFSSGDKDFKAQLTSIKAKNPEVIFLPAYYTEVALIARQAKELGINVPIVGGDGWDSPVLIETAGDALEGCYFSNHVSVNDTTPVVKNFVDKYKQLFGTVPDAMGVLGYDAGKIIVEAIKESKTGKPEDIRNALAGIKNFPGVTGSITIDENRNANKPLVVLQIKGSGFVPVESVMP